MFTFFNNPSNSRAATAVASIAAVGNVIWLITAANTVGFNNRAVNSCFQHYNITDANVIATEECWHSYNIGRAAGGCRMEDVYDQYTMDHCGTQLGQQYDADSSLSCASLMLIITMGLAVVYGCSQAVNISEISTSLTELIPMQTATYDGSALLPEASGGNDYSTFAVDETSTDQQSSTHCSA